MLEREIESECCGKGVPAMDTPDRNQITTPTSKFEDSPLTNFINTLSPLKPVKSLHITQTYNSLTFASLPSVFTSPQASSFKDSRFLRRHQSSNQSNSGFSAVNGNKVDANEGVTDNTNNSIEHKDFEQGNSFHEGSVEAPYECSELLTEPSRTLSDDYNIPGCSPTPQHGTETSCVSELAGTSTSLVPFHQDVSDKGLFGRELDFTDRSQLEQSKEEAECDWETLISEAGDLLIFDSPNEGNALECPFQKSLDPGRETGTSIMSKFMHDDITDLPKTQVVGQVDSGEHERENHSTHLEEGSDLKETGETEDVLASTYLNQCAAEKLSEKLDNEPDPVLQRGMRRRCLVFEMAGARRKQFDVSSSCGSSMSSQTYGNIVSTGNEVGPERPGNDSTRYVLPGIGLHLNALTTTSKDYNAAKHENWPSGKQLTDTPDSTASIYSSTSGQKPLDKSLASTAVERDMGSAENGVMIIEDASQASGIVCEESNQSSSKKKRRRSENDGDAEGCKRCNCKKSKCLKLYCECFAAGVYCVEPCSCQDCFNQPIHEDTVLATRKQIESRNPLAFAPKVVRSADTVQPETGDESNKTPASARHKRGCNCKKSGCLKKYCECYQGGVGCSINCRCEGCKNAFGRKDGPILRGTESEVGDAETCVKNSIQIDAEQTSTPLQFSRSSVELPFSSKGKPPRSSFHSIGSSSGFYAIQRFGMPNFFQPQTKFEKHLQTVNEDEIPEILQGNGSPITGVKTGSPNSKRVSPPQSVFGSSPGRSSSRKLLLQSIPSFPSLTPKD